MAYLSLAGIAKIYGGARALDGIDLSMAQGEFLALLGPSGCGKTTLLQIIAGLVAADAGRLELDGMDMTHRPAWSRDIGLVFQHHALFPHMNVRRNVAFGLEMRRLRPREIAARVEEALEIVQLSDRAEAPVRQLSGGQQQRVAIARAIAIRPRLLLLDEPLSSLDAVLRGAVRTELRALHGRLGLTTVMVTHDQADALTMADSVAVMRSGRIVQHASPVEVYERPSHVFVAGFVGSPHANLLPVTPGQGWCPAPAIAERLPGRPVTLGLRPETLQLVPLGTPHGLPARIVTVEYLGADRLVHLESDSGPLVVRVAASGDLEGPEVAVLPDPDQARIFDTATGVAIS